ncbi:MAG: sulfite exporter TauE/SafE family protein [Verrucomicrobiota bacterium]
MFDPQTVYNGYTALLAGLVTSVHCVAMCGPLTCAFSPKRGDEANAPIILTSYHLSKLLAYGLIGAFSGAFGSLVLQSIGNSWFSRFGWVLVFFFVFVAFRLDRFFPKPVWLGQYYRKSIARFAKLSKPLAAGFIGFASPLLPCGPLYMIFGLALFSGSAVQGAEFALGFGIGTIPLLWLSQTKLIGMSHKLNPHRLFKLQRALAFVAALVIAWRLRTTLGIEGAENWVCHPF